MKRRFGWLVVAAASVFSAACTRQHLDDVPVAEQKAIYTAYHAGLADNEERHYREVGSAVGDYEEAARSDERQKFRNAELFRMLVSKHRITEAVLHECLARGLVQQWPRKQTP